MKFALFAHFRHNGVSMRWSGKQSIDENDDPFLRKAPMMKK
jgi:hypothetical protein